MYIYKFSASFYLNEKFFTSTINGLIDDVSGTIGGNKIDLYQVKTEHQEGFNFYCEGYTTTKEIWLDDDIINEIADTLALSIESLSGTFPQQLDVKLLK